MTLNQEVEIIYLYIVEGLSMEKVGEATGWETSAVSQTVRDYGFNDDAHQRSGWQSGKDRGRYGRGKAAARGVNVNRQIIRDFLQCADEWEWDFEWYISEIAQDLAEQNRSYQLQQQQRAAQQQWEQQQRIQAEQNARIERERREREMREQQQRQREQEQRQKEQEQKNITEYYRLLDAGKAALKANKNQQALDTFYKARELFDAAELNILVAEILATASNADVHCKSIIRELSSYERYLSSNKQALNIEQLLWYARALVADNQSSGAINRYAMAANIAYTNKDYIQADTIYKECYSKTGYYCSDNPDHAFDVAYARSCVQNITADDHRFCIDMYKIALRGKINWHRTHNWDDSVIRTRGQMRRELGDLTYTIIGAGSLGSHVAEHLVRQGAKHLKIIDGDLINIGNLARHVLSVEELNRAKTKSLAKMLINISPSVQISTIDNYLDNTNVSKIENTDVIIDCSGNNEVLEILSNYQFGEMK